MAHQISFLYTALSQTVASASSPPAAHDKAWAGDVSLKLGRPILRHVYVQIDSHDTALVVRECLFDVPAVASKVKRNSAAISAEVEP